MAANRVLVLGGVRSGKSRYAQQLLAGEPSVRYLATGYPPGEDADWAARIAAHVGERPPHWVTVETTDVAAELGSSRTALLIDCMTLWLTRVMDAAGAWDAGEVPPEVGEEVARLLAAWRRTTATAVVVTNEVGMGVVPPTPAGIRFRDLLGSLNRELAAQADTVWLVVAGLPLRIK